MRLVTSFSATVFLALAALAFGCWSSPHGPVRRDMVVGDYVFRADDRGTPHDADRLSLRADGSFTLLHMPDGRAGAREEGRWQLWSAPDHSEVAVVLFGHGACPILVKGNGVRLIVNWDLGYWYEKVGPTASTTRR